MSINTNPSELGTISTNVSSTLTLTQDTTASVSLSSDTAKTKFFRLVEEDGVPWVYTNTGTVPVTVHSIGGVGTNVSSATIAVVNHNAMTADISSSVVSSEMNATLWRSNEDFSELPNHKRNKVNISTSSVTHHPAVKYDNGLTISSAFGSALTLRAVHTNTTFSIPYSSTTNPIFISYATSTTVAATMYGSLPRAWNPVYKTIAIAGATSTATTFTGAAGTVPTTWTVTNFEYDFSESITQTNVAHVLTSTVTATHKGHLNITSSGRTTTDGKCDIAWSEDGKYLAAIVGLNALTTAACGLVVASMDTSTKILTSVATATFASENNASYSVCWSGNSQIFIGGAYYSAGNYAGIMYSFNTATNSLTLGTLPAALTATPGLLGIDRFDNGNLLCKIGVNQSSAGLKIYNPTTSSTITIDLLSIFSNVLSTHTGASHPFIGQSYGSSSHLHPFAYTNVGGDVAQGYIANHPNTSGLSVLIYNSQSSSVTGVHSYTAATLAGSNIGSRANICRKTKYGLISFSVVTSNMANVLDGAGGSTVPQSRGFGCIGDFNNFTTSSIFGSGVYVNPNSINGALKYLLEPGQTMIISSKDNFFNGGTGNSYTKIGITVQEAE